VDQRKINESERVAEIVSAVAFRVIADGFDEKAAQQRASKRLSDPGRSIWAVK
jgi:hypothetical protein